MPQAGFTPIITYHSTTGAAVPDAANLSPGELALNIADMKLYAENSSGVVTLLADAASAASTGTVTSVDVSGGTTGLTFSGGPVTTNGVITVAGTLAVANGGTGLTTLGSANQVLAVNSGATALEYQTVTAGISTGKAIALSLVFG
jgi:hypothetical protein